MNDFKNDNSLVSVCISVYNGERFIKDTLLSIIDQTYKNIEILIIDNDSSDNTVEIVEKVHDKRIRLYKNNKNIGVARNWNQCIEKSKGEYIAIYHADDIYETTIVEEEVRAFLEYPGIGAVFTSANIINQNRQRIGSVDLIGELKHKQVLNFYDVISAIIINGQSFIMCPSCMTKRSIYLDVDLYDNNICQYVIDVDFYMRLLEKYPIRIIDKRLLEYRLSISQDSFGYKFLRLNENELFKILDRYVYNSECQLGHMISHYETLKREDYSTLALNHLANRNIDMAKYYIKKTFSLNRFAHSFKNYKKFRKLLYSFGLFAYIYCGRYIVNTNILLKLIKHLKGYS